jgi:MYXO-CTERM domain-containing protein
MVAWDNSSGLYPTWAQATVGWALGQTAIGHSLEFTLVNIGGSVNTPPPLFPTLGSTTPGLQSFNLYLDPEPPTAALAALGAVAFFIFRRRRDAQGRS